MLVKDVGLRIPGTPQVIFNDDTHGFALERGPYNQNGSFKVVRFSLPNLDQVTKPLEIAQGSVSRRGLFMTYECIRGFVHKKHIFVHCGEYIVRFPKNSFDSTAAPAVETFHWPDEYEKGDRKQNTYWVMNCGGTGFIHYRRVFSFELDNFGKYGKAEWMHPMESTSGACNHEYGFSVVDTGSDYQPRSFVRWTLSDVALQGKVPGRPGFAATVIDGAYGYALPGYDYSGNFASITGPTYHMARFNLSDFTAETTDIINLKKRNPKWTYFYRGFAAGSCVYMVPHKHTSLLRFPLVK